MTMMSWKERHEISCIINPLAPGEQTHLNHPDCPAGLDTKRRLYVKRTHDGARLLMYCHHCGSKGVWGNSPDSNKANWAADAAPFENVGGISNPGPESEWKVGANRTKPWSDFQKAYEQACDISELEWPVKDYFSERSERKALKHVEYFGTRRVYMSAAPSTFYAGIWIPRWNSDDVIVGFDIRTTHPNAPKWLRIKARNKAGEYIETNPTLTYQLRDSDTAVLVEDPISAWKIALAGFVGVAICGSELDDWSAYMLGKRYQKLLVWLDNDSDLICTKAAKICRHLSLYSEADIKTGYSDPKNYTAQAVKEAICE